MDFAANAESLGARAIRAVPAEAGTRRSKRRGADAPPPCHSRDIEQRVGGYDSWWDVPIAEVSTIDAVQKARDEYVRARKAERDFL